MWVGGCVPPAYLRCVCSPGACCTSTPLHPFPPHLYPDVAATPRPSTNPPCSPPSTQILPRFIDSPPTCPSPPTIHPDVAAIPGLSTTPPCNPPPPSAQMLPQFLELFSELLKTQRLGTHNPHSSYFHKIAKQLKSPEVGGDYSAYPQSRDLTRAR